MREECQEFPEGSRRRDICNGVADLPLDKINAYRRNWGLEPLDEGGQGDKVVHDGERKPMTVVSTRRAKKPTAPRANRFHIGDKVAANIKRDVPKSMPCGRCKRAIGVLNTLTPDEVRQRRLEFAADIESNALENSPDWWTTARVFLDQKFNDGRKVHEKVVGWIDEAVQQAETEESTRLAAARSHVGARGRPRWAEAFRSNGEEAQYVTYRQLVDDVQLLLGLLPANIAGIIGVARSGLDVAAMLAKQLHLPLWAAAQDRGEIVNCGSGYRIRKGARPEGAMLLVDDTVMTGNSMKAVVPWVREQFPDLLTAAVYVNPIALEKPDIWARDLAWPHLLEWNLFNSILSPNAATDFDGILCLDCPLESDDDGEKYREFLRTARPLFVPRREPIPLIVTARLKKYRRETEDWLDEHNIKCKKLVMGPWATLGQRRRDDVAAYKAEHFEKWAKGHRAQPAPLMFIESDDAQARRIHEITGRLIVSPHAGRCYQ